MEAVRVLDRFHASWLQVLCCVCTAWPHVTFTQCQGLTSAAENSLQSLVLPCHGASSRAQVVVELLLGGVLLCSMEEVHSRQCRQAWLVKCLVVHGTHLLARRL